MEGGWGDNLAVCALYRGSISRPLKKQFSINKYKDIINDLTK